MVGRPLRPGAGGAGLSRIDPEAIQLAAGARSEQAARRLVHTDGLSLRDAATVLGVTFGRVQQLLKD